jgi:hypothetical protein
VVSQLQTAWWVFFLPINSQFVKECLSEQCHMLQWHVYMTEFWPYAITPSFPPLSSHRVFIKLTPIVRSSFNGKDDIADKVSISSHQVFIT